MAHRKEGKTDGKRERHGDRNRDKRDWGTN